MKTIKEIENIIIINKSKFITNLYVVNNIDEVNNYLNIIKNKYKDATHYCYAYIIDNNKRFSDDNEPNGTAGMPILNVLEKNNLNHTLAIVTRYFGGIKLGAGPLTRAYSNSVSTAINNTNLIELIDGYKISITFDYNKIKEVDNLLSNYEIINKNFDKNISYVALVDEEMINILKDYNLKIIEKIKLKK